MIVSKKSRNNYWYNLEGPRSRLAGPCGNNSYIINGYWHRLYGRSCYSAWDLNDKSFDEFKEV